VNLELEPGWVAAAAAAIFGGGLAWLRFFRQGGSEAAKVAAEADEARLRNVGVEGEQISELLKKLHEIAEHSATLTVQLTDRALEIEEQKIKLAEQKREITRQQRENAQQARTIDRLESEIAELLSRIDSMEAELERLRKKVNR
jgi:predicted RNase H-like nuclease (RuvC/YqgF family)